MVHLIEREGYTSLVADVFTKESTIPETVNEVFKAFMSMVELKHSTLEEIITYLTPEDFQTSTWDLEHASQTMTDDTITETVDISESVNVLVHGTWFNFIQTQIILIIEHSESMLSMLRHFRLDAV